MDINVLSVSPIIAKQLISENLQSFEIIVLTTDDYYQVIQRMVTKSITGGDIYDALIAQVLIKEEIDSLLTLNPNHFTRLGEEILSKVKAP